jgi:nicotinamide phosphoribosyltransferase
MDYYNTGPCAYSVYATEHSIMTARGEEGEFDVVDQLLTDHPTGILSVVIDSYNYKRFIEVCGTRFKDRILARDGKFVFRPDSGDPVQTSFECFNLIAKYFGYTVNDKGYKVLDGQVGILWGDGIDIDGIREILAFFKANKIAATNIVFGMGGALLQKVDRDTQRCAFKSSYQVRNGIGYDIFKDPLDSSKASKKGKLALIQMEDGTHKTLEQTDSIEGDRLNIVFENGNLFIDQTLDNIRKRAAI